MVKKFWPISKKYTKSFKGYIRNVFQNINNEKNFSKKV